MRDEQHGHAQHGPNPYHHGPTRRLWHKTRRTLHWRDLPNRQAARTGGPSLARATRTTRCSQTRQPAAAPRDPLPWAAHCGSGPGRRAAAPTPRAVWATATASPIRPGLTQCAVAAGGTMGVRAALPWGRWMGMWGGYRDGLPAGSAPVGGRLRAARPHGHCCVARAGMCDPAVRVAARQHT